MKQCNEVTLNLRTENNEVFDCLITKAQFFPPGSEASREVANLTERKNSHTTVYGVKELVCLSVCPSVTNFDPNYGLNTRLALGPMD